MVLGSTNHAADRPRRADDTLLPTHRPADARPPRRPGPVALSGGGDDTRAVTSTDRALLACLTTATPRVVVIPATATGHARSVGLRALHHWSRLGAAVDLVALDGTDVRGAARAALAEADVIVLSAGRAARTAPATDTGLWPYVVDRWRQGAALLGSAAGATVLCAWRQQVGGGRPLRFVRGPGVIAGAVAPHFDRPVVRRWTLAASRAQPYLTIVGIDERTAIVGRDGRYAVHGAGAATIVRAGACTRFAPGCRVHLTVDATPPVTRFPQPWAPAGITAGLRRRLPA